LNQDVPVHCYSGHTYAGRPLSFFWEGKEVAVQEVLDEWREPSGPVFRVRTERGVVTLAYEEREDRWWVRRGVGPEGSVSCQVEN
jgi:hypothetical protein